MLFPFNWNFSSLEYLIIAIVKIIAIASMVLNLSVLALASFLHGWLLNAIFFIIF